MSSLISFNPSTYFPLTYLAITREIVAQATEEYLKNGGKITKIILKGNLANQKEQMPFLDDVADHFLYCIFEPKQGVKRLSV